ncbi:hypothetical protein [Chryseobacterium sp. HR92]|uniref:hypothetical protein n=1 Tax=Chryseobacterium sp. HR92 TaxID=3094839 RepID=UPI003890A0A3|nr:hypothetical protein SFA27_16735 [Chryseobacterium sp. HR92]
MSKLGLKKTVVAGDKTIFAHVLETALGGFVLDTTGLTVGDKLLAGTAFSYDEATRMAKPDQTNPKGLLYEDVVIDSATSVDIVLRGTVYTNRIPALTDALKAKMPQIIFSLSK